MHKRFQQLGSILVIVILAPFLFLGGPETTSSPVFPAIWNLGHLPIFAALTVCFRLTFFKTEFQPGFVKFVFFSLLVLFLGVAIEWAQYGLNRNPDWHDIWRNQLGAWLAWSVLARPSNPVKWGRIILGAFLLFEIFLIFQVVWIDWKIQNQLPIISRLEKESDLEYWGGNISLSQDVAAIGNSSLKVTLTTTKYSGTGLKYFPYDWRNYSFLEFEVYNPDPDPLRLTLVVRDKTHDQEGYNYYNRYNDGILVIPGWNHIEIPLEDIQNAPKNRKMDMKNIIGLGLFATNLEQPRVIYFDDFRLK